jgi:hypothetical protein
VLWKAEVGEDGAEVFGHFGGLDSSNELGLGGGRGDNGLEFGAICDGAAAECESQTGDGATGRCVRTVGGVDIADEFVWRGICRKCREGSVHGVDREIGAVWEGSQRCGSPVQDTTMDGLAEIFGNPNEASVMGSVGASRVTGEGTHGVTNVKASGDIGVE